MCVTSDVMVQVVEANVNGHLAFGKQRLQLLHSYGVVLSIVQCEVANLMRS